MKRNLTIIYQNMRFVTSSIKNDAPLDPILFEKIEKFKESRNWLAHGFDEESTPFLSQNKKFEYYIEKMEEITLNANEVILKLYEIGETLIPTNKEE